jgi:hypothetical protein
MDVNVSKPKPSKIHIKVSSIMIELIFEEWSFIKDPASASLIPN